MVTFSQKHHVRLSVVSFHQENPQGGKKEVEDDNIATRTSKGERIAEPVGMQNLEQRQMGRASQAVQAGPCVSSLSLQPSHTDLDSDVSDDTDRDLDIEDDDDDLTLN